MKLTKALVRCFEQDQQDYGTKTALFNLLWQKAAADLRDIGASHIATRVAKTPRKKAA